MPTSIKNTAIWRYAWMLRNQGEKPAVVIQAKLWKIRKYGKSGRVAFPLAEKLSSKLSDLGPLWTKRYTSYIGCCAEVVASNKLLLHPQLRRHQLKDLKFSPALRPRTMQVILPCQNCVDTFV